MSPTPLLALSTIDTMANAERLADTLVAERLAACVNIIPVATSVYRWNGRVQRDPEHLLIIKTSDTCWDSLCARVRELHPYDCPELIAWPLERGLAAYLNWVIDETR